MSDADVIMGGGSAWFLPQSTPGSKRKDGNNYIELFQRTGYKFASTDAEMKALSGGQAFLERIKLLSGKPNPTLEDCIRHTPPSSQRAPVAGSVLSRSAKSRTTSPANCASIQVRMVCLAGFSATSKTSGGVTCTFLVSLRSS
jgi:hypothetical protein